MLQAIRVRVRVQRGGLVVFTRPELAEGSEADVVVMVEQSERQPKALKLPTHDVAAWPKDFSITRAEIYDDTGR